jgi:hypothetical protein
MAESAIWRSEPSIQIMINLTAIVQMVIMELSDGDHRPLASAIE